MKKIEIEGFGVFHYNPIDFEDFEGVDVDSDNNEVKRTAVGEKATYKYLRVSDGVEVPSNEVMKRVEVNGEQIALPKLPPTSKVEADEIEVIEDKENLIYFKGADRKQSKAFIDDVKMLGLLNDGKALSFPVRLATGRKVWRGILNKYSYLDDDGTKKDCYGFFCVRGNIDDGFKMITDAPIKMKVKSVPKEVKQNTNKLYRAMTGKR